MNRTFSNNIESNEKINNLEETKSHYAKNLEKITELEKQIQNLQTKNNNIYEENYKELLEICQNEQTGLQRQNSKTSESDDQNSEFVDKIRILEQNKKALKKELEEIEQELQDSKCQIKEINKKNKCLEKELKEYKDKYSNKDYENKSSDDSKNFETKIKQLIRENKMLKQTEKENAEELKESEIQCNELSEKLKNLKKELKDYKNKSSNDSDENESKDWKKILKSKEKSIQEKDKIIDDYKKKLMKLEKEYKDENQEDQIENRNTKIERQKTTNKELISKIENLELEIDDLKKALKSRETSIKEKEEIIDNYKTESRELNEKLKLNKNLEEVIESRNSEIENQNSTIDKLKKELEELKLDNEKKQVAIVNMREKIRIKNTESTDPLETKKLQSQIKAKDMELDQLHAKVDNLNSSFDKASTDYEFANKKIAQLQAEIDNMKKLNFSGNSQKNRSINNNQNGNVNNQFPDWWSKHMTKLEMDKNLEEEIKSRNRKIENQNTTIDNMKKELKELKSDSEKKQQAIVNMRDKLQTKNAENTDPLETKKLQSQIRAKDIELDQLHAKVDNLNSSFDKVSTDYELTNKTIAQLQAEITNMKKLSFSDNSQKIRSINNNQNGNMNNQFPDWWSKHMTK